MRAARLLLGLVSACAGACVRRTNPSRDASPQVRSTASPRAFDAAPPSPSARPGDASAADVVAPPARTEPSSLRRGVLGPVPLSGGGCRLTVGDSEVPIEFDAERPVLTLTRADLHGPAEFWARSNGVVAAALVTESETDGPTTDCVEASAVAGIAALPLSASGWTSARLYVATRVGERGPFVAGLRAPGNDRATATPEPIAPRARDEAAAFWRIRERPCAEDQPCGEEEFVIEGAFTYAWSRAVESARADCGAWTRDDGRPERFGFSCGQSLWRGVSVRVADREVVLLERTGTDLSPAGRPRVLRRIAIPPGVRLVPRAMGLLSWDHPAEPRQDS